MPRANCPSAEVLESFLLGQMVGPEADALEQHLERCEHCLRAAAVVGAVDKLVATARQVERSPMETPFGELVEGLIQRCAHLSQAQDTQVNAAATTSPLLPKSDFEEGGFHFLAPAQGPGEIGRLGAYRVLQVLGKGGMGVVFLAEDTLLGRHVALKVIRPALAADGEARERFLREARAAAVVKHDHIVTIYQVGEERGTPFLAMEYLEGETLDARLRRDGPLPFDEVLRIGREIAEGLAAAHTRGVTHRDIKPSNIWLEARAEPRIRNSRSRVKVLDFGLARILLDARMTHSGQFMGTPAYMAPEQAQGRPINDRADLFSLGCVLYEMATGISPFSRPDTMSTLMALANFEPPLPIDRQQTLPVAFTTLVERLLAKDPANRPTSAHEVVESLWEIEHSALPVGSHVVAKSLASTSDQIRPRRTRYLALLVALVPLVVAGALALWHRANERQSALPSAESPNLNNSPLANSSHDAPTVWPIDSLLREKIPEEQLRIAGDGDPSQAPAELVSILGDGRLRHWTGVNGVVFSPDGQFLASASGDHTVRLWDASNGGLVRTFIGHQSEVFRIAFAPKGDWLVSADLNGIVLIWEVATGAIRQTLQAHAGRIWFLDFADDGQRLASAGDDGRIRLWRVPTGEDLGTLDGNGGPVEAAVFVPQSNSLISGGADGKLRLWNLDSGDEPTILLQVSQGRINSLACSRDGRLLAVGNHAPGVLDLVKLLDLTTRSEVYTWNARPGFAAYLAFRRDGKVLAFAAYAQFAVRLLDIESQRELPALMGHQWGTAAVAFHPDGRRVASGSWDGSILLWDSITGEELLPRSGHQSWTNGVAFSQDGQLLATGSRDSAIKLWDVATGEELRTLTSHRGEVTSLEFRRDGQLLASGSADATVKLWDTRTWKVRTLTGHGSDVRCISFNSDGRTVASASADQTIKLWESDTGLEVRTLSGHVGQVNGVAWAPDDRVIVSGSPDCSVKVWEEATGLEIEHLAGHTNWVESVAYSSDGKLVASSGNDNTVRLWNPQTGQPISTLIGHEAQVHSVTFSPDAQTIASAAFDGTIRLWDPSTSTCRQVIRLGPHGGSILRVAFSPDGRHLATTNGNGTVYILRLSPLP